MAHTVYAEILAGEVKNLILCENYETASHISRATYGKEAIAVDASQYPVEIGDLYEDGNFYKPSGELIEPEPDMESKIQELKDEQEDLTLVLAELIGG